MTDLPQGNEFANEDEMHQHAFDEAERRVASHPAVQQFYELLALKSEGRPDLEELAELSAHALKLHNDREWEDALDLFDEIGRLRPGDGEGVAAGQGIHYQ